MGKTFEEIVDAFCLKNLGRLPNLVNPEGYNDKIQWLKLYDQMPEHIVCVNKYLARSYVAAQIGEECLLDVYAAAKSVDTIDFDTLPEKYVLKTNHDSGSVFVISNASQLKIAKKRLREAVKVPYGHGNGEWAYSHVTPIVYAEEFMDCPIVDYKFHCCNGHIKWVHIISQRNTGKPVELIVDSEGTPMGLHLHAPFRSSKTPIDLPTSWEEMKNIACELSSRFKYVRVDLYDYKGSPKFGELTFWPEAGAYKTADNDKFGELLDFDLSTKRPQITRNFDGTTKKRRWVNKKLEYLAERITF